jgi:hypothetical protein
LTSFERDAGSAAGGCRAACSTCVARSFTTAARSAFAAAIGLVESAAQDRGRGVRRARSSAASPDGMRNSIGLRAIVKVRGALSSSVLPDPLTVQEYSPAGSARGQMTKLRVVEAFSTRPSGNLSERVYFV